MHTTGTVFSGLASCGLPAGAGGGMYNAMLHPLLNLRLSGFLWDQGEANVGNPPRYASCFPAAIADWRMRFSEPALAFLFVQIGPSSSGALTDVYGYRNDSYGVPLLDIRHAQLAALALPAVGMATVNPIWP